MILALINEFITVKLNEINSRKDVNIKLNQIQSDIDIENIADNERFINYQLYIESVESENYEFEGADNVTVRLDFIFNVANKDYNIYRNKFDSYIWEFRRLLKNTQTPVNVYSDSDISSGLLINDIKKVSIRNADKFENDLYKPSIEIELFITDYSNTNILDTQNVYN